MSQRSIIIRADANSSIGMGHMMRTLSIADAFKSAGNNVRFILADDTVRALVNGRGYEAIILNSCYAHMVDELNLWPAVNPDLIIVDSYYVTSAYLSKLREMLGEMSRRPLGEPFGGTKRENGGRGKLVYIDDVLSFPYPVDILINYNAYASQELYDTLYVSSEVDKPRMVLGPTYAPLRSMFRGVKRRIQPEVVRNILISTGGSDELHLSLSLLEKIVGESDYSVRWVSNKDGCKSEKYIYHFLVGAMNADKEAIHRLASEVDNAVLHDNVTDMRALIDSCDLAISAAGSTLYEIAACGVPLITYSLADNQIPGGEAFERLGIGVYIGDLRDPTSIDPKLVMSGVLDSSACEKILSAVDELADDYDKRVAMGKRMQEMIDGLGADRMIEELLENGVRYH